MPNAKLGAKVDRYSFFVRLLPPLLHTGLARRTNIPITLTFPEPRAGARNALTCASRLTSYCSRASIRLLALAARRGPTRARDSRHTLPQELRGNSDSQIFSVTECDKNRS